MRVPYIINSKTIEVYKPSKETLELIGEQLRKCVAENFEWDTEHCPSLEEFCLQAIAKYFHQKPLLDELPYYDRVILLDLLPLDLSLEFIIPILDDEYYWERRYKEVFKFTWRKMPSDWTWKSQYLERHCQKIVEEAQPQYKDEESFNELLVLCNSYVTRLFVEQLQRWIPPLTMEKEDIPEIWPIDHIDFKPIFKKLNKLEEFDLIFGMKNVGENFAWDMFQLSVGDCLRLGKALQEIHNLRILRIHRSKLEYTHCKALVQGLLKYPHLEELDLSHCNLGDTGVLCIAHLLQSGTNLNVLNLTNNGIGKLGAEGIGFAMCQGNCENLAELILRLNPLGKDGTNGILRAIVRCSIPKKLSLAACMFEDETSLKICQMLKLNDTLKNVDISCNWFGPVLGKMLVEAISEHTVIEWIDTRDTNITAEQREQIDGFLERNRKAAKLARLEESMYEIGEVKIKKSDFVFNNKRY